MAAECAWVHYDSCESLELLAKPYSYHPPSHVQRHWPRALSALVLRIQLQLRHRLGITVSLPTLPWSLARRASPLSPPHPLSPSANTYIPAHPRSPQLRLTAVLRVVIYAFFLAPPLLLALILLYGGLPPSYADVRQRERALPQHQWHSLQTRIPEGARGVRSTQQDAAETQEMYLRFPDHVWGHGLNNVLQEAILTTHLTLATSTRTPVFEPYTWSHLPLPYTLYDFALRPTRVPLSAFVGGVLTGAVGVDTHSDADERVNDSSNNASMTRRTRRAVSAEYFEHVCPPSEIVEVVYGLGRSDIATDGNYASSDVDDDEFTENAAHTRTRAPRARSPNTPPPKPYGYPHPAPALNAGGREILAWFERRLRAPDVRGKRCVVVREDGAKVAGARKVFDAEFFGSQERILPLLPELLASPVLRHFAWSPLVSGAVERSIDAVFGPGIIHTADDTGRNAGTGADKQEGKPDATVIESPTIHHDEAEETGEGARPRERAPGMLDGVLALHLRRGDYSRHCVRLAQWGAGYLGVNGALADRFGYVARAGGADVGEGGDVDVDAEREFLEGREERTRDEEKGKEAYYLEHCLPSIEQVVRRLREVRADYESQLSASAPTLLSESNIPTSVRTQAAIDNSTLATATATTSGHSQSPRHVYVLTNGWPAYVDALRRALLADGWAGVVATADLERGGALGVTPESGAPQGCAPDVVSRLRSLLRPMGVFRRDEAARGWAGLTREERGVDVGVDMGIAERAEVFVGNGFSSLSANIVMLRIARGFEGGSNRLL